MKTKLFSLLAASCLMLQSCATVFSGNNANVRVPNGTPEKAKIYVDGAYVAEAPETVKIAKGKLRDGANLTIKADGYKDQNAKVGRKMMVGWLVLDIVTGLVPAIIDLATGNIYKATPSTVKYSLEKQ